MVSKEVRSLADLVSYTIPSLIQGVSNQPDAQRDPTQGEIQVNGVSSIAEGLRKRDGTRVIAKVSDTSFGDAFIHSILRDDSEKYLAVITKTAVKVFDLAGSQYTVNAPGGYGYLTNVTDARQQVRAASIADYTFISNTNTVTEMDPALAPQAARPSTYEALVWVKAANYGQEYKLLLNGTTATVTTAVAPVVSSGLTVTENRISTAEIANRIRGALIYGPVTALTRTSSAVTLNAATSSLATTTDEAGTGLTVNVTGNGSAITAATIGNASGTGYKAGDRIYVARNLINGGGASSLRLTQATTARANTSGALATTTNGGGTGLTVKITGDGATTTAISINVSGTGYHAGDNVYVTRQDLEGGAATLSLGPTSTSRSGTSGALTTTTDGGGNGLTVIVTGNGTTATAATVSAVGSGYRIGDKVYVSRQDLDGTGTSTAPILIGTVASQSNTNSTAVLVGTVISQDNTDVTPVQVATVSTASAGPLTGVTISRSGSVLWLQSSSPMTIAASDAKANADITAILNQVQAFTELPTIAPVGYQVEIAGDPGNNFDGYYVEFKPKSGTFGEGTWGEVVSPGVEYKIKATTMPHILVRLPSGQFHFGPADGSTQGGVVLPAWGQRTAGDYITSPDPSFIGYAINDITVYKSRLVLLADENIILSRTREFFEFFPETVTTVLDTDPIDLVASNNRVSVLRYAVPYQDELILFSSQYQFRFNAAETVLTPATAQITVLTQYELDPLLRPMQVGGGIVFCQANGGWSQFREFSFRGAGTALTADTQDLTGYVSSYIPRGVYKAAVNDTGNSVYFISSQAGYENRIYVYKFFFRNTGNGAERAQSSWSYWEFKGKVLQIICIREALYCLFQQGSQVFLELIPVQDRSDTSVYPLLLDREISTTTDTPTALRVAPGTYNATTKKTTWTLPFTMLAPTQAWSALTQPSTSTSGGFVGGVLLASASSGNTLVARGDWSTAEVFFGEPFEFRYRFSRFQYKKELGGGKASVNYMRTQVRSAKLRYHETGYFEVHVFPEYRESGKYIFDGTVLAVRDSQIGQLASEDEDAQRYYEGVFNIPIMSRGNQCLVEIRNSTPHPCKFSTCEWAAILSGKTRGLQ